MRKDPSNKSLIRKPQMERKDATDARSKGRAFAPDGQTATGSERERSQRIP
ncbi:MAG: hypothetical protein HOA84_06040 [Candidatus Jacksonbacteria bacterium]|nr:hypothetical protein [Candidatus Jacksonbacteria bacterium]